MRVLLAIILVSNAALLPAGELVFFIPHAEAQTIDPSCLSQNTAKQTLTLKCGQATLSDIYRLINNEGVLAQEPGNTWLLDADLYVDDGARLLITNRDTSWLKLESPHGLVAYGDVIIDSVRITSWNSLTDTYAKTDGDTPRSFIGVWEGATGQMNITNSELAFLGYGEGRKQGLSYYGGDGSVIRNNEIHHMWYGFFSDNVGHITLEDNRIHDNQYYGIDPHSGTHNMVIRNNLVYNIANGIAIICSDLCRDLLIEGNEVYGASVAGIMLSKNTTDSVVRNNSVRDGGKDAAAISIDSSDSNEIYNNTLSDGRYGIKIARGSSNNVVSGNSITEVGSYGICMADSSSDNSILYNVIKSAGEYGICTITGSSRNDIAFNDVTNPGLYGIYVKGFDVVGNHFRHNSIEDSGQNGIRIFENKDSEFTANNIVRSTKADYSGATAKMAIYNTTFSSTYFDGRETEISVVNFDRRIIQADRRLENSVDGDGRVSTSFHLEEGQRMILSSLPLKVTPQDSPVNISVVDGRLGSSSSQLTWIEKRALAGLEGAVHYSLEDLNPGQAVRVVANKDTIITDTAAGENRVVEFATTARLAENLLTLSTAGAIAGNTTEINHLFDNADTNSTQKTYACEIYRTLVHCDPLLGDLTSYSVEGKLRVVQPLTTSDASYVEGKVGKALKLSARYRESIEVMNTPGIDNPQFSFSFWVRDSDEAEPYGHVVSHTNFAGTAGWVVDMTSTMGSGPVIQKMLFSVANTEGEITAPSEIEVPRGQFVHVAGTFDGSYVRIYLDGSLVSEAQFQGTFNPDPGTPLRIGSASYSTSTHRWSGIIDELQLFDKALSEDEVLQIANLREISEISSGVDGNGHLKARWAFENNFDDTSGQGNSGSLSTLLASMAFAPDGRMFFSEKNTGKIRIMKDDVIVSEPFAQLTDVYVSWEQGLLGLTLDPKFAENHYVYQYYVYMEPKTGDVYNRVVRFTDVNNKGIEMKILLDRIPAVKGYHSGGALAFGPDDKLYITVGDATEHPFAQDPNVLIGKVLRIERDGSIPTDNPDPSSPVYTMGHRNSFGLAFDGNGIGIMTENGESAYDEINILVKGGNYGFPTFQPANMPPEYADPTKSLLPARSYYETVAPTQALYYTGDSIPELKDRFLFGTFTGDIFAIKIDPESRKVIAEERVDLFPTLFTPVIGIAQSPDGDLYYGSYAIFKLESLSAETRLVKTYPIRIAASQNVTVSDLTFNQDNKKITLDLSITPSQDSEPVVAIKVPRELMDEFTGVVSEADRKPLPFTVVSGGGASSDGGYNIISVDLSGEAENSKLSMIAVRVIPEFPSSLLVMLTVFAIIAAVLILMRRSGLASGYLHGGR